MPYRAITIDHTKCGAANSSNFPVLLTFAVSAWLRTTANGGSVASASGFDIVPYADSALTTKLPFELAYWSPTTGQIEMWVKIPTLSATTDTVIYLGYGNAAITSDQQAVSATWSNGFARVFHFDEDPTSATAPQLKDSVANANALTANVVRSGGAVARGIGKAGKFDLSTTPTGEYDFQFFNLTPSNMGTGSATISGWFYRNTDDHSGYDGNGFLFGRTAGGYPYACFNVRLEKAGGVSFEVGTERDVVGPTSAVSTNAWHHVAAAMDTVNNIAYLYLDGAQNTAVSLNRGMVENDFQVGGSYTIAYDEVHAASVLRSASWILAEYNNQNSPATFYSVGAEVNAAVSFSLSGIASAEAFGIVTVSPKRTLTETGIPSAEAFGTVTKSANWKSNQTGIASAGAFGTLAVSPKRTLAQTGIASIETLGTLSFQPKRTLAQTGIPTVEALGTFTVILHSPQTLHPAGLPSVEALGTFAVSTKVTVTRTAIASAEAFGAVTVTQHDPSALVLSGIPSAEAFGTFTRTAQTSRSFTGIATAAAFGVLTRTAQTTRVFAGIASTEALGLVTRTAQTTRVLTGAVSTEAFGAVGLAHAQTVYLTGIASAEAFGAVTAGAGGLAVVTTFPNGQVLTSDAISPQRLNMTLQTLTCQMLGLDPDQDPTCYAKVRLSWPTGGQPPGGINEDICFLRATEEEDAANSHIRDRRTVQIDGETVASTVTYTRVWRVSWTLYGPNSFDRARLLKSALLDTEFPHDAVGAHNLFFNTDLSASTRAPELFQGQWWDRTDVSVKLSELVTETLTVPSIASAGVLILNETGQIAEVDFPNS